MFNHDLVKIVDLGCSNFYADSIKRQTTIGTRLYWSPEVIAQEEQNDRLDIWCVGVVLYELIYLDQPFSGNDIERKIRVTSILCQKCEYSFPNDKKPEPELEDLFRKIFTNKSNRISAGAIKEHPWIRSNH
jgi:serine/threonine protein kinase